VCAGAPNPNPTGLPRLPAPTPGVLAGLPNAPNGFGAPKLSGVPEPGVSAGLPNKLVVPLGTAELVAEVVAPNAGVEAEALAPPKLKADGVLDEPNENGEDLAAAAGASADDAGGAPKANGDFLVSPSVGAEAPANVNEGLLLAAVGASADVLAGAPKENDDELPAAFGASVVEGVDAEPNVKPVGFPDDVPFRVGVNPPPVGVEEVEAADMPPNPAKDVGTAGGVGSALEAPFVDGAAGVGTAGADAAVSRFFCTSTRWSWYFSKSTEMSTKGSSAICLVTALRKDWLSPRMDT
jgi:hypothetical protein